MDSEAHGQARPTTQVVDGPAATRVLRIMALALAVGGLIFAALAIPKFVEQFDEFWSPWSWAVLATFVGSTVAMATLSFAAPARLIRMSAAVVAVCYLLGLLTVVPALGAHLLDPETIPWLFGLSVIGTSASAVAWQRHTTVGYVGAVVLTMLIDRIAASADSSLVLVLAAQDTLFNLLFDAIFTSLALTIRRAGQLLDITAESAVAETRRIAIASAQARERNRMEALVHDTVLVALLASSNSSISGAAPAAIEARRALAQIGSFGARSAPPATRTATEFVWGVQSICTELAPHAQFSHVTREAASVPSDVAEALVEGATEALRNSLQHADRGIGPVSRAVHVTVERDSIEVTVLDDGIGFDPAMVPSARLGIAVSILARMNGEPGGFGIVVSKPGHGTRVTLRWVRP